MKRRNFLVGAGAASIGGSAILGSGAFSRIESQRSVTIQVAEDPDAYLGMDKCSIDGSETPNSSYAWLDDHGHLEILMNEENPTTDGTLGEGINSDSRMWVDNIFQLCNQGKEDACVWIEDHDDWPEAPDEYDNERRVDFYLGGDRDGTIVGEDNAVGLELGECICIGLKTNSKGLSEGEKLLDELDNEIRIVADVGEECTTPPPEDITETGRLSLSYEDLPKDNSDWDYNDWVVDIFGTFLKCGQGGTGGVKEFQWDIVPQARGAADEHLFEFDFNCGGSYDVTYYDEEGGIVDEVSDEEFDGTEDVVDITIWEQTSDVFDDLTNTKEGDPCVFPDQWARLTVTFDECCEFDAFDGNYGRHGEGLPFNPVLDGDSATIEKEDIRLLVVEDEWDWPTEQTPIWQAYGDVDEVDGKPEFGDDWEDSAIPSEVKSCSFEVDEPGTGLK